jgi:hypothetical protein
VQSPFVVLGDEAPEVVRQRATRTVKWAVDKLKQGLFSNDQKHFLIFLCDRVLFSGILETAHV